MAVAALGRLLLSTILIVATIPPDVGKALVADRLREAAKIAGCEVPVVEMGLTRPGEPQPIIVWCRRTAASLTEQPLK